MGMTIDEAIKDYEDMKKGWNLMYPNRLFDFTIETMRKYEKIEEIVKEWREVGMDYDSCDAMDNIERVINNGNVD